MSCIPLSPDADHAAEQEFARIDARIDAESRAICPEDEDARRDSGQASNVTNETVDTAVRFAAEIEQRLDRLKATYPTNRWTIMGQARVGSLFDCIWTSLRPSAPTSRRDPRRGAYLYVLPRTVVYKYVTAVMLARRYALYGGAITRARQRLFVIASILGDDKMSDLVAAVDDPTDLGEQDPSRRRHVHYTVGMFGSAGM